jgi:hypothetical protein
VKNIKSKSILASVLALIFAVCLLATAAFADDTAAAAADPADQVNNPSTAVDAPTVIEDGELPASESGTEEPEEIDIQEPEIPLADASQQVTGDGVVIWVILAVMSGAALVYTIVYDYKHSAQN